MNKDSVMPYFKLYENCILVKGSLRSIICDLQFGSFKFIPNDLYDVLILAKNHPIVNIKKIYENKFDDAIDEYLLYLNENELGFWQSTENNDLFPPISLDWDEPSEITNCILDFHITSPYEFKEVLPQLEKLGCKDIQIRFYSEISLDFLSKTLYLLNTSRIKSVELMIKNDNTVTEKILLELCDKFPRIKFIIVHSSPEDTCSISQNSNNMGSVLFVKDVLQSEKHCGIINSTYFRTNLSLFSESQQHNTCLNRKISIDVNGEIKNCPSINKSYGNIKNTTLQNALDKNGFKDVWKISKDKIEKCKDCEFRHICTDCRAYIEKPDNIYSKPLKCGYDPYTAKWEEWSSNPLKQKAIESYELFT
jgi:SPASM domain peptide maturase of grasp-with-spasm system